MAQTKATKKFEKNHLKDTLKRRKEFSKIKQRNQIKAKRKARHAEDTKLADGVDVPQEEQTARQDNDGGSAYANMSVDEFFAGGFEVPMPVKEGAKAVTRVGKRKRVEDEDINVEAVTHAGESNTTGAGRELAQEDDMGMHKDDLKALETKDPEFFKYLQENDAELLDFAENSNLAEVDELSVSEDEAGDTKAKRQKNSKSDMVHKGYEGQDRTSSINLGRAEVQKWSAAMANQHSLRAMRETVLAFRAAAHLNDEDDKKHKYSVSDADVYHEVLLSALKQIPDVLNHHLPVKELSNGKMRVATDSKKFKSLTMLLKSHATSILHLLEHLSDAATLNMTLTSILSLLAYMLSFKKLIRDLSRAVIEIWSDNANPEATRISAFLILRRLTIIGDPGIRETVLRASYQGLIKGSRSTTLHSLPGINLMKNSAAELWGLADPTVAYTSGFTLIRQLAIHLRNSIKNNSNDSYKTVYNWQYVHSLDFWSRVISTQCDTLREASSGKQSPLRPLIYPLVQVTLGAVRLIPTSAYFPLRFQLVRSLLRISHATHTFIPLAAQLYEVLTSAEMKKPPKPSTLKPLDYDTSIRVSKTYLRTRVYQDGVGEQVAELMAEFFNLWAKSIAFPELALPVIVMLKRWLKEVSPYQRPVQNLHDGNTKSSKKSSARDTVGGNKNMKVNSMISLLIQKLDANARFIEERRAKVDFAPKNRAGVEGFLKELEWTKTPLGAFVDGQRKAREERKRVFEEGRRQDEARRLKDGGRKQEVATDEVGEELQDDEEDTDNVDEEDEE